MSHQNRTRGQAPARLRPRSPGRRGLARRQILAAVVVVLLAAGAVYFGLRSGEIVRVAGDAPTPAAEQTSGSQTAVSPTALTSAPSPPSAPAGGALAAVSTPHLRSQRTEQLDLMDPSSDGWESEAVAGKASSQLKKLGKILAHAGGASAEQLQPICSAQFSCRPLRPASLKEVFREQAIVVRRDDGSGGDGSGAPYQGVQGLARALDELKQPLAAATGIRTKFKVIRVDQSNAAAPGFTAYFQLSGKTPSGSIQQTATWDTRWAQAGAGETLHLTSITVRDYEETVVQTERQTLFVDCTEAVLGKNRSFHTQLGHGVGYWLERLEGYLSPRLLEGHNGLAVGDVNGDGLEDVYICQPGGLPNRLLLQDADGTVRDVSPEAGVDLLDWSTSALLVDLDNDGDQDLVVLTGQQVLFFANDGRGQFLLRAKVPGAYEFSLCAADYDNDGDLDVYVANYFLEMTDKLSLTGRSDPMHNSNLGGRNALLRNDGQWRFTDVTDETGLDANNRRWTYAAAWEDYDNDGDVDLYVANDFGHNNLYRNEAGSFTDVAVQDGAVDSNFGMSVTWGDYNRDGLMDIYVSNMFSSAGNRVTFQTQFKPQLGGANKTKFQMLARGNTLLENAGDGTFRDVSDRAHVTMGRWAWGSLFVDIDNDGWQDLLVANGYLTQDSADDL